MEVNFSVLRQKDVINLNDGRHMGKVCDLSFTFPENNILGFTVTGCKGFKFSKQEVFIPIKHVVKIGKDAVLVKFGEDKPDCPPLKPPKPECPPPCPPNNCPPCPPPRPNRRSYDEYE